MYILVSYLSGRSYHYRVKLRTLGGKIGQRNREFEKLGARMCACVLCLKESVSKREIGASTGRDERKSVREGREMER